MDETGSQGSHPANGIRVSFVDLPPGEHAPAIALYALDPSGRPAEKMASAKNGVLPVSPRQLAGVQVAIGPDVENPHELTSDRLLRYRGDQVASIWEREGLTLPKDRWGGFYPTVRCVSGHVRKCRPWWYDYVTLKAVVAMQGVNLSRAYALNVQASAKSAIAASAAALNPIIRPWHCVPLCDGVVEIYERQCCCIYYEIPSLIDHLGDILKQVPIPWPPHPGPGPEIGPRPGPGPDPAPFRQVRPSALAARATKGGKGARALSLRGVEAAPAPPQRLLEAYNDLRQLSAADAQIYVRDRVWLHPFCCSCSNRRLGEVAIQPGGEFDFCYRRGPVPINCWLAYAYRVRQLINGVWVTVYDGVASGAWFGAGETADLSVTDGRALPCGDPPGDGPPGDGSPFVMLEYVTDTRTHHFNFPGQTAASQVGALDVNDGLYKTTWASDCPWGAGLGLRLRVNVPQSLEGTVAFYRMTVMPVDTHGNASGAPSVLHDPVSWSRLVNVNKQWVVQSDVLGPVPVGAETNLFRVPYWSGGMNWLSGQMHQNWNTTTFPDGRYMLIIELFDSAGARIKPAGAAGPGAEQAFQFRRWTSDTMTADVPFADCAHVFWIDNMPVTGSIVDLRKNDTANSAECQFMNGSPGDQFSIGYRAFHMNGVSNSDSFMYSHAITWQRGLKGATGSLATAFGPTVDTGEGGPAAQSGSASFSAMLGVNTRCTFSVHLEVNAKHFNGGSRLSGYDYNETASFALEQ